MTQREQLIAMLDEAGVDWGYSEGDCIVITNRAKFRFGAKGNLREVTREDGYYEG